jgi:DNA-binding transcriptional ArsR family regulator
MTEPQPAAGPRLSWDIGTAYELFVSLTVLHAPENYGIRASWAAGIRSRIPTAERKLLEETLPFIGVPMAWLYTLPRPKDAISAMWALRQIPPAERLVHLLGAEMGRDDYLSALKAIAERRSWDEKDLTWFLEHYSHAKAYAKIGREQIARYLDWWTRPDELGEGFLAALQAYHQAFFEEEEKRLAPVLEAGLERARQLAAGMHPSELLTELSQGVQFDENITFPEIVIIPAFWSTPLLLFDMSSPERMLFLFGARPASMAAIPGEMVPEGLLRSLKALADPTRLKILYHLEREAATPSELARHLHLRPPTVTHHLSDLRLAGLVNLTVKGQEKLYRARREALRQAFASLESFLDNESPAGSGPASPSL